MRGKQKFAIYKFGMHPIRVDTIASLEKSLIIKKIARLEITVFKQVIDILNDLIKY